MFVCEWEGVCRSFKPLFHLSTYLSFHCVHLIKTVNDLTLKQDISVKIIVKSMLVFFGASWRIC